MPRLPYPCLVIVFAGLAALSLGPAPAHAQAFVNWESPHVHPIDLTPDHNTLLVVNTPDNRLEVFTVAAGQPVATASIPVGLDPVSVRARSNTEAWVVNRISDNISVVDLSTARVVNTFRAGDEPADVVFAGAPQRAFVSLSGLNRVRVYDPATLTLVAGGDLLIAGQHPRALATDGVRVFAAIFESGNHTTLIDAATVSASNGPYGGQNPPPNSGTQFSPPIASGLPAPPAVGLIVKKIAGLWQDDNPVVHNWSSKVTWDLHDHDVAIIASTSPFSITYAPDLMNINMHLAVRPDGQVSVIGTDAINHVRFEPNVRSKFVKAFMATFDPAAPGAGSRVDLNPHLAPYYDNTSVDAATRAQSIGDPRAIVWSAAGDRAYVAGMGSNNVIVVGPAGQRLATIDVGHGPTGLALDESRARLYVVNKFDGTLSTVNTTTNAVATSAFFDPTPQVIRDGRPFLYDTHLTSGLGQVACGSCHLDARMDNTAWDLGDPGGAMKPFNQQCNGGLPPGTGVCSDWHPMKGPMATQTLIGIVGTEPLHWRGDRENLAAFNPAFFGLLGGPMRTAQEMNQFQAFLAATTFPPQPNRNFDGSLKTSLAIDDGSVGNPANGFTLFQTQPFDGGVFTCVTCHTLPTGGNRSLISANNLLESQSFKVPQLRNINQKGGFLKTSGSNNRGYSLTHDGNFDTLVNFLRSPVFRFTTDQQRRDVAAFVLSFPTDTHASVGWQQTLDATNNQPPSPAVDTVNAMLALANPPSAVVGVVAKGRAAGVPRGWAYLGGGMFQSDRAGETATADALRLAAGAGSEITFTIVPLGSQTRIGIDRDLDGALDRDELDGCGGDPANSALTPRRRGDMNGDGLRNAADTPLFAGVMVDPAVASALDRCVADMNGDGNDDAQDIQPFVACVILGACP